MKNDNKEKQMLNVLTKGMCLVTMFSISLAEGAQAVEQSAVEEIVRDSGVAVGLAVHLGTTDGRLETALAQGGRRLVHGWAADEGSLNNESS